MPSSPTTKRHRTLSSISSLPPFIPQRTSRHPSRLALLVFLGAALALTTYVANAKGGMRVLRSGEAMEEPVWPMEGVREEAVMGSSRADEGLRGGRAHSSVRVGAPTGAQKQREAVRVAGEANLADVRLGGLAKPARRPKTKQLPVCKKTVLFRFAGRHGFGSEVSLLLRVASVAHHYGYTVFLDSTSWNYGSWSSYFSLPPSSSFPASPFAPLDPHAPCRPPSPQTKRYKLSLTPDEARAFALHPLELDASFRPNWAKRNHVYWLRDVDGLDATFLRLFVDQSQLEELHRADLRALEALEEGQERPAFLGAEETLPRVFEDAFERMSRLVGQAWTPNEEVKAMVGELEKRLGVSGAENPGKGKRPGDLLVGVHVRLGDKFLEADRIGPASLSPSSSPPPPPESAPGLTDDLTTSYYAAAVGSINSLLSLPSSSPSKSPQTTADRIRALFALSAPWSRIASEEDQGESRPTLALMSDDPHAVEAFRKHPMGARFRVVGTAEIGASVVAAQEEERERRGRRGKRDGRQEVMEKRRPEFEGVGVGGGRAGHGAGGGHGRMQAVPKTKARVPDGFNETAFNRLPLSTRISSARLFVRDLTVLSSRADALVVTGSSNVGRLMMLLFKARRREKGERRGEVRSLDTSPPVQTISMPVLPTDILQMIFDELDAQMTLQTPRDEADRRRMGLSLSLVCRAWRQAGTAFCWRVFTLMARDEDDVDCGCFDHLLDHPHLAALVRTLYVAWPRSDRPISPMSAGEARLKELLSLVTGVEVLR
ncbi:hypothetical protein NBRC10512v2_003210 [Rhodotorula toruloides]